MSKGNRKKRGRKPVVAKMAATAASLQPLSSADFSKALAEARSLARRDLTDFSGESAAAEPSTVSSSVLTSVNEFLGVAPTSELTSAPVPVAAPFVPDPAAGAGAGSVSVTDSDTDTSYDDDIDFFNRLMRVIPEGFCRPEDIAANPLLELIYQEKYRSSTNFKRLAEDLMFKDKLTTEMLDQRDGQGVTPLGHALVSGNSEAFDWLLQHRVNPTKPFPNTTTVVQYICLYRPEKFKAFFDAAERNGLRLMLDTPVSGAPLVLPIHILLMQAVTQNAPELLTPFTTESSIAPMDLFRLDEIVGVQYYLPCLSTLLLHSRDSDSGRAFENVSCQRLLNLFLGELNDANTLTCRTMISEESRIFTGGFNELHIAVLVGSAAWVSFLLREFPKLADGKATDDRMTPLEVAVELLNENLPGSLQTVRSFCSANPSMDLNYNYPNLGQTIGHLVARSRQEGADEFLIELCGRGLNLAQPVEGTSSTVMSIASYKPAFQDWMKGRLNKAASLEKLYRDSLDKMVAERNAKASAIEESVALRAALETSQQHVAELKAELATSRLLTSEAVADEAAKHVAPLKALTKKQRETSAQREALKLKVHHLEGELRDSGQAKVLVDAEVVKLRQKVLRLTTESDAAIAEVSIVKAALVSQKPQVDAALAKADTAESKVTELSKALSSSEATVASLRAELAAAVEKNTSQLKDFETLKGRYSQEIRGLSQTLAKKAKLVKSLQVRSADLQLMTKTQRKVHQSSQQAITDLIAVRSAATAEANRHYKVAQALAQRNQYLESVIAKGREDYAMVCAQLNDARLKISKELQPQVADLTGKVFELKRAFQDESLRHQEEVEQLKGLSGDEHIAAARERADCFSRLMEQRAKEAQYVMGVKLLSGAVGVFTMPPAVVENLVGPAAVAAAPARVVTPMADVAASAGLPPKPPELSRVHSNASAVSDGDAAAGGTPVA